MEPSQISGLVASRLRRSRVSSVRCVHWAFLAATLTIFLILMLDTFSETRWLANVMGMGGPEPDAPDPEEPAVGPTERPSVSS